MSDEVFPNGTPRRGRPPRNNEPTQPVGFEPQRNDPASFDNLLSQAEIEQLRADARAAVLAEQKQRVSDAMFAEFLKEERQAHDPKKKLVPIFLQLAGHAQYIMLDCKQYHTNNVYHVTEDVYAVLVEQMNRGWAHEDETQVVGKNGRRSFRPPPGIGYANFMDQRVPRNIVTSSDGLGGEIAAMQRVVHG